MNSKSAYSYLDGILNGLGIQMSGDVMKSLARGAESFDELYTNLQDRPEWKHRFRGNAMLEKQGKAPLPEAEYLSQERAYEQVFRSYGMPKSMYNRDDFAKYIGNNVSVQEMADRVKLASDWVKGNTSAEKQAMQQIYGFSEKEMLAMAVNPARALPDLQKYVATAELGGASKDAGLHLGGKYLESLVNRDVSTEQAKGAFAEAADQKGALGDLARIDHTSLSQSEIVDSKVGGASAAKARKKMKGLAAREAARFSGAAATTGGTFSSGSNGSY